MLDTPFTLGGIPLKNRVGLAPLAGIGTWFVRLQAMRHGAGFQVSEMVSSHAIHHRNPKTLEQLLKTHPDEERSAVQLFGPDPEVMRSAAAHVGEHTDFAWIDLNMGCPVPKVMKTGSGAALLKDHDTAIEVARAAHEGSGLPVTVKLRSGQRPGETDGAVLARRLVEEAGVAAITFHPRSAAVHHKGTPGLELAEQVVEDLEGTPVLLSGGMDDAPGIRAAAERTGAAGVVLARGQMGNPWLFAEVLGLRDPADAPSASEALDEALWTADRACEHLGPVAGARWMRKAWPWFAERAEIPKDVLAALLQADSLDEARALLAPVAA